MLIPLPQRPLTFFFLSPIKEQRSPALGRDLVQRPLGPVSFATLHLVRHLLGALAPYLRMTVTTLGGFFMLLESLSFGDCQERNPTETLVTIGRGHQASSPCLFRRDLPFLVLAVGCDEHRGQRHRKQQSEQYRTVKHTTRDFDDLVRCPFQGVSPFALMVLAVIYRGRSAGGRCLT